MNSAVVGVPVDGVADADGLIAHEARSELRRLIAVVVSAWDRDDKVDFASCLTEAATVTGFGSGSGMHWLGNEQIVLDPADPSTAQGSWLWWGAETTVDGRSVHLGGDLRVDAVATRSGWRFTSVELSLRYRCPVDLSWLLAPPTDFGEASLGVWPSGRGTVAPFGPLTAGVMPTSGPAPLRQARLVAERDVRALMAEFVNSFEVGRDADDIAELWLPDGLWDVDGNEYLGRARVSAACVRQLTELRVILRLIGGEHLTVTVDTQGVGSASGHWREQRIAVIDEAAYWLGLHHHGQAVRHDGRWYWQRLRTRTVLRTPYGGAWALEAGEDFS